jgi:lysophospholipase L1-like esterase
VVAAAAVLALVMTCATPASASANTLYVGFGDSVGAGWGASAGQDFFDQYCAYLESAAVVNECVNEAIAGATSSSALASGGMVQKVISDIESSTDTPVVTVVLGANDLLGTGCQPITASSCLFITNMRTILNQLETALATRPGPHTIQWLEYYNPNHDNPYGNATLDQAYAALMLGNDFAYTDCSSYDLSLIGLDDAINCVANEKGATPVDAYTPFQSNCTGDDCFSDALHPDDEGYGLIFDAFRDTQGGPVPSTPPPDGSWPFATAPINMTSPAAGGSPTPGSALTCSLGLWSGTAPLSYTFQWLQDGTPIPSQTASTYLVQPEDVGHLISCQLTASNPAGSASATSSAVTVSAIPSPQPPTIPSPQPPTIPSPQPPTIPSPQPPTITALSETRHQFAPSSPHHRGGTAFSFRLDQPAKVTITLERQAPGRRAGESCRPPSHRLRHDRPCVQTIKVGAFVEGEQAVLDTFAFSGRVHGRALAAGRYVAVFVAVGRAGVSPPRRLSFSVTPG